MVAALNAAVSQGSPLPLVVTEVWNAPSAAADTAADTCASLGALGAPGGIESAFALFGGAPALRRSVTPAEDPPAEDGSMVVRRRLCVIEGTPAKALAVHTFPSWGHVEECAASAELRDAVAAFERDGGGGRAIALVGGEAPET